MRIAVAGSGRLAFNLMQALLESSHEVVALVQNGRTAKGLKRLAMKMSGYTLGAAGGVIGLAMRHGIPTVWIDRMGDAELAPLRALRPDILLVGGFGVILKRPILDLPRIGCVNMHSSLLPRHRGPNPFSAVILGDEAESGVTFHVMDEGIDTGDILEQHAFPIEPSDTGLAVYQRSCALAGQHVVAVMDRIEKEGLRGTPQDHDAASYDRKLKKEDSFIRWEEPARAIERRVRGLKPFFMARFRHRNRLVIVTQARGDDAPVAAEPGTVLESRPRVRIATGRGTFIVEVAFASAPVPWLWPAPWCRPEPGEKVS